MKKGFTLIELLAVIVILAIIALISTPIVLNVIKSAEIGAYKSSAQGIMKSTELALANELVDSIADKELVIDFTNDINIDKIEMNGTMPENGYVTINNEGNTSILVYNNKYCAKKSYSDRDVTVEEYNPTTCTMVYNERILNGADPVLGDNLIPVIILDKETEIDGTTYPIGTVIKADTTKEWYRYNKKEWANAVILTDSTSYDAGDVILENNIESYFVWIPRYKYKLFNLGDYSTYTTETYVNNAQTIEIVFESKEVESSNGNTVGSYLTHPAFISFNSNGIWAGKFEITGTAEDITVKPNTESLKEQSIKGFFDLSYNYERDLNSHMIKNTEWGAVAYLSYSKYGINKEINVNNNENRLTGYSAVEGTNQSVYPGEAGIADTITQPYNTSTGYKASTTGNITGVYDMSGGTAEYVAGYIENTFASSGFDATTILNYEPKYFDVYSIEETFAYSDRLLGDATGEMGPFYYYEDNDGSSRPHSWNSDNSVLIESSYPWFYRGGNYSNGSIAGAFYFFKSSGAARYNVTSRLVLAP